MKDPIFQLCDLVRETGFAIHLSNPEPHNL